MKIISIVRLVALSLAIISIQQTHCARKTAKSALQNVQKIAEATAAIEEQNMGTLATAFAESDLTVKKSTEIMNKAFELLLSKDSTQAEDLQNIKTIIEQNKAIVMAQQKLEKMRDEAAKKVETDIVPEGYWNKFVSGVKNAGAGIAALFSAGTGTEEEKATARLIIKGLTEQEVKITEKYALLLKDLSATEKAQLKGRYDAIIAQIEAAIYEQQLITGDTKSSMIKRGLLLGAAAAGTVATGALLKSNYFKTEEPEKADEEPEASEKEPTFGKSIIEGMKERTEAPTIPQLWQAGGKKVVETAIESAGRGIKERTETPTIPQLWQAGSKEAVGTAIESAGRGIKERTEAPTLGNIKEVVSQGIDKASNVYKNWQEERDFQHEVVEPITKIISEEAAKEEQQIDAKIAELNDIMRSDLFDPTKDAYTKDYPIENSFYPAETVRSYLNGKKKDLERKKEAAHNLATNPDAYLAYRDRYWTEGRMMGQIIHDNKEKESELITQFNEKHPGKRRPIRTILGDKVRRKEETKENISDILTSAEEYEKLLSPGE